MGKQLEQLRDKGLPRKSQRLLGDLPSTGLDLYARGKNILSNSLMEVKPTASVRAESEPSAPERPRTRRVEIRGQPGVDYQVTPSGGIVVEVEPLDPGKPVVESQGILKNVTPPLSPSNLRSYGVTLGGHKQPRDSTTDLPAPGGSAGVVTRHTDWLNLNKETVAEAARNIMGFILNKPKSTAVMLDVQNDQIKTPGGSDQNVLTVDIPADSNAELPMDRKVTKVHQQPKKRKSDLPHIPAIVSAGIGDIESEEPPIIMVNKAGRQIYYKMATSEYVISIDDSPKSIMSDIGTGHGLGVIPRSKTDPDRRARKLKENMINYITKNG